MEAQMNHAAFKKIGLTGGAGAALVAAGALFVGGPATAGTQAPKSPTAPRITGAFVNVAPGANGIASVSCPAGTVVTGGGGVTSAFRIFFTDSFRSGNGWTIRGTNTGTNTESIAAVAVCQRTNTTV
jgi:hypothetical protein